MLATSWSSRGSQLVTLFTNCALEASVIFLPLFANEMGASKLQIGIIGGAFAIAYAASSRFFGRQSDIKGRLIFIRLGLGLGIAGFAAQALAVNLLTLIIARALVGLCIGISVAALMAYNFEVGGSTGRFASFGSLGWLLGDVIAIFFHSYDGLFLLGSASCGLAFAISLSLKEPEYRLYPRPATLPENSRSIKPDTMRVARRNILVYLPFFLRHLGATMVWVILPLFFASLGASNVWIAVLSSINTGGQFVAMMFVERLRESRLFILGFVFSALVFLAYSRAANFVQIIPVQALLALAWSCLYVGALVLLLKHNEEKATSTGILFSTTSIAGAVGPFLGGLVSQFWGYQPLMYLSSGLCVSGLMIASMRLRWKA